MFITETGKRGGIPMQTLGGEQKNKNRINCGKRCVNDVERSVSKKK
ncbi:hypothetical protein AAEU42_03155 [Pseudoflavonifractor phocaeensis]